MRLDGKQKTALVLTGLLLVMAGVELEETISAIHFWWWVGHPAHSDFVVTNWRTPYTVASALFAPMWFVCAGATLALSRRWPIAALVTLSLFLVIEPLSCVSAPSIFRGSEGFLGLEELPFAGAERAADWEHLAKVDAQLKRIGVDAGVFPTSYDALKAAVGDVSFESSPYEQNGKMLPFDLKFVSNRGTPYAPIPEKPGIVYYAVNFAGTQFVLTISGLNAPVSNRSSMMKAEAFVREKQPWDGLLATEESLHEK